MKLHPIQSSFQSGELSPRMLGRTETDQYKYGLAICENMVVDARGPARSRTGTSFEFVDTASAAATEVMQVTIDTYFNLYFTNLSLDIYDSDLVIDTASIVTPWPASAIDDIFIVEEPGGLLVYLIHPLYQTQKLAYDPGTGNFTFSAVSFTSKPAEWTGSSWPGVGAIFQGRLWLGGTENEQSTFWGSKSGAYEDFSVSSPVVADDAIIAVAMERFGRIQWMEGTKNLVLGCTTGEYLVVADSGLLQPGDLNIKRQSAYGSKRIQAIQINERLFYVSADGRKVRTMYFEFATNNWVSDDILFISEHLSEAGIVDIRWSPNPDNLLWALLADGTLISCTYERGNKILGWHRHNTDGTVLSISTGELSGTSYMNVLVERVSGDIVFEVMGVIGVNSPMDSYVSKASVTPVNNVYTITGLDHLEGLEVQILADGAVKPVKTVSGGEIELTYDATEYIIGVGYRKRIKTLPFDMGSETGSGASHMKRYSEILVRVLDSAAPLINGMRPPDRNPATPMNEPEQPRTEDIAVHDLGWDRFAQVEVEQDLPLDLTVVAIFGDVAQENF